MNPGDPDTLRHARGLSFSASPGDSGDSLGEFMAGKLQLESKSIIAIVGSVNGYRRPHPDQTHIPSRMSEQGYAHQAEAFTHAIFYIIQ